MCLRLVLLFLVVPWACAGFLRLDSTTHDQLFAQVQPAQYLFTPRDYRAINELALVPPPPQNSYILYYSPTVATTASDYVLSTKRSYDKVPAESKQQALLIQPIPYVKKIPISYPALYLEPPPLDSVSNYEKFQSHSEADVLPRNHRPDIIAKNKKSPKSSQDQGPVYIRDHAPIQQTESESEAVLETKVNVKKKSTNKDPSRSLELSSDGDRIEFQIQGHEGPKTYIFGFDTGDGKNRQFRLEERLKDGTVKGHYGYYDARGKLRTIRYLARPLEGYKEKHHESNSLSSEEKEE